MLTLFSDSCPVSNNGVIIESGNLCCSQEPTLAMMETQSLERQNESMERNIAFLKKGHMELLQDLHLEILRLQKHCKELTMELESKQIELSQQDQIDQEMEEKCRILEASYHEKEQIGFSLKKELYHRENRVAALRSRLRDKERRFLEEVKRRSHRVTILNTELQKQTEAAAYLSFQLHTAQQKLHSAHQSCQATCASPAITVPRQSNHEVKVKNRIYRNSNAGKQALADLPCTSMSSDSFLREPVCNLDDIEPMPDPALFLYPKTFVHTSRQRPEAKSHKTMSGHNYADRRLATQWPEGLSTQDDDTPSTIPIVKAKLPRTERGKRRAVARQELRDSE
uniref:CCDC92/74 N-terminal domain-containing protein n=2 Tax=Xenopus tropicalis TaxID=8364 RepID=A0A803K5D7_XENTR